jgi:hypothetical protein
MIAEINGVSFDYFPTSKFVVQVGRYTKGSYKTRYSFVGNICGAMIHYEGINIGRGYKKRLVMDGKVLARANS